MTSDWPWTLNCLSKVPCLHWILTQPWIFRPTFDFNLFWIYMTYGFYVPLNIDIPLTPDCEDQIALSFALRWLPFWYNCSLGFPWMLQWWTSNSNLKKKKKPYKQTNKKTTTFCEPLRIKSEEVWKSSKVIWERSSPLKFVLPVGPMLTKTGKIVKNRKLKISKIQNCRLLLRGLLRRNFPCWQKREDHGKLFCVINKKSKKSPGV